jgi:hypothetical protein
MNKTALVFCVWQRDVRFTKIISMLEAQSFKQFDVFIWNNDINKSKFYDDILKSVTNLNVEIKHSNENVGGFGRFYYSKEICNDYESVIFIDDDQDFGENMMLRFVEVFKPNTIHGWWAFNIIGDDYFNRRRSKHLQSAKYVGTGGMICDSNIFKAPQLFEYPYEFTFVEDLWMSYVVNYILKWNMYGVANDIKIIVDNKDQSQRNKNCSTSNKKLLYKRLYDSGWC